VNPCFFVVLPIALVLSLARCGGPVPDEATAPAFSPPSPESAARAPVKKNGAPWEFRAAAVPLPQANRYRVEMRWDAPTTGRCLLERQDVVRGERKTLPEIDCARGSHFDDEALAGRRYRYRLHALEPAGPVAESSVELSIPRDLVLRGEHLVPSLAGVARLFLLRGTRLRTEGQAWRGELDALVAEDAVLETFREDDGKAPAGTAGKAAGAIQLRIRRASGSLRLRLTGQDGGDGFPGVAGAAGKDGADGKRAVIDVAPQCFQSFPHLAPRLSDLLTIAWEGREFPGGVRRWMRCSVPATHGADGAPGAPGQPGTAGGRGGASPRTLLVVDNGEDFRWSLVAAAGGIGGRGGPGGPGGLGGRGGNAGATDKAGICPKTLPGKDGATGARGADGPSGADGLTEPVCVVVAGSQSGDCEPFQEEIGR
jgi:hypothetical protein